MKSNLSQSTEENNHFINEYLSLKNTYFIPDYIEHKLIMDFLNYYNEHLKYVMNRTPS